MLDGAGNGQEFEPLETGVFFPALVLFAYALGVLIAVVT